MKFREATVIDIPQLQIVRQSVIENVLSDPALVTVDHYIEFLTYRGKGWVCEIEGVIIGFAIADLQDNKIWALFLNPEYEGRGIGRRLHDLMMHWYFSQGKEDVWLSTSQGTRAEKFYKNLGWKGGGFQGDEIKFVMSRKIWFNKGKSKVGSHEQN